MRRLGKTDIENTHLLVQASIIFQNGKRQADILGTKVIPSITKKCANYSLLPVIKYEILQCSTLKDVCFLRRTDCVLFHAWSSGITWWLV